MVIAMLVIAGYAYPPIVLPDFLDARGMTTNQRKPCIHAVYSSVGLFSCNHVPPILLGQQVRSARQPRQLSGEQEPTVIEKVLDTTASDQWNAGFSAKESKGQRQRVSQWNGPREWRKGAKEPSVDRVRGKSAIDGDDSSCGRDNDPSTSEKGQTIRPVDRLGPAAG